MDRSGLAIIVPAYNEAATIVDVVAGAARYGDVIVVDDASRDDTVSLAVDAGARVVRHHDNKGYDASLQTGIDAAMQAGYAVMVTLDADGEHDPQVLGTFKSLMLDDGVPLVLGRRRHTARWAEAVSVWLMRAWLGVDDILCGCKGYNADLVTANSGFDHCRSTGMELAAASVYRGVPFAQIDVSGRSRQDLPRFGWSLRANMRILGSFARVCARLLRTRRVR